MGTTLWSSSKKSVLVTIFLRIVLKKFLTIIKKIVAAIACESAIIKDDNNGPNMYPPKSIIGEIKPSNKTQMITLKEKIKINIILFSE